MSEKLDVASSALALTNKIYDDVAHSTLEQLGKLIALPVAFLGYPAELLFEKYKEAIQKAIDKVPTGKQTPAKPSIAAPIIEHMKYVFEEEELLTAFTRLLASCIDIDYTELIHPSFIEKIKQLSSFDLKVLEFASKQFMLCYSTLCVNIKFDETKGALFPRIYLFTNMQEFNGDTQQVDKSIDLLVSLGILEVDRKEIYREEEYASRLVAFLNCGYKFTYASDLFSRYTELCTDNYIDDYEGTLYNHDRFFYGIELSPELQNILLKNQKNESDFEIETIDSTRRIIKLTSYGEHFNKAIFRKDEQHSFLRI